MRNRITEWNANDYWLCPDCDEINDFETFQDVVSCDVCSSEHEFDYDIDMTGEQTYSYVGPFYRFTENRDKKPADQSKRYEIASKIQAALVGRMASHNINTGWRISDELTELIAKASVKQADALLKELEK